MDVMLSDGSQVLCEDQPFNQGAEGALFWSTDRSSVIKLYFQPEIQRRITIENILSRFNLVREDPIRTPFFAWPDGLVIARDGEPALGIRMPAIADARPLDTYIRPDFWQGLPAAERGSWAARVSVSFRMARILRWMHNRGLCHSDLSPKNFLANLNTAQTTLIDCDGLVVPNLQPPSVLGTPECMAPELVAGRATPTIGTDRHALAVLIYWTLLLRHPLRGPRTHHQDPDEDERLAFGDRALYIEHPTDSTNRPSRLPFTSQLLTTRMRRLFNKAFVDGLHDEARRPLPSDWEAALLRMADQVVACPNPQCEMKAFVAPEAHGFACPWCGSAYRSPGGSVPLLRLFRPGLRRGAFQPDDWSVVGVHALCWHHVDLRRAPEPGVAPEVLAYFHCEAGRWLIVNQGLDDALVLESSGSSLLARGSAIPVAPGSRVVFGREEHHRVATVEMLRTS